MRPVNAVHARKCLHVVSSSMLHLQPALAEAVYRAFPGHAHGVVLPVHCVWPAPQACSLLCQLSMCPPQGSAASYVTFFDASSGFHRLGSLWYELCKGCAATDVPRMIRRLQQRAKAWPAHQDHDSC